MSRPISDKRPWLAALLAAFVTGLGHLYLRRWRRALGWLLVLFAVTVLFVDPATVNAFATGGSVDPLAIAPIYVVGAVSVIDAYLLARAGNFVARITPNGDGEFTHCPNCGKELDGDLDFCQWCSTDLADVEVATPADEGSER
ncbi:zinc ribbon domain-containing protein [Halostella salina]|uniref:zinc ribbon domain-containing protein n=1 Tax=Halostella salina TaxID=1547897 RepID=UPI000EF7A2A8|nr:zinc ribbon domain-containing protein [Halostella salina]